MSADIRAMQAGEQATEDHTPAVKRRIAVLIPMVIFLGLCCAVLPYAGVEGDEALFAGPLYSDVGHSMKIRAFHHDVPLMLMSYLGTAKTWLYGAIFHFWRPGLVSLRLPPILIGAATLWAFYELVFRLAGRSTAVAAVFLLATDATFVLTTTFDWGPVAIQHLTFVAGLLWVLKGYRGNSAVWLGAGFFLFGLGMWDKAIFIWVLSGAALAILILWPAELRKAITRRRVAAGILGFLAGASPLVIYNLRNPLATFQGNAVFSTEHLSEKTRLIRSTLSGSALFVYLVNDESAADAKPPHNALEQASVALREFAGEHRSGLLFYGFVASLLLAPFWWRRRRLPVLFALIIMVVAWPQMAFVKDAGTGAHHVVLLWPWPHLVVAIALVETAGRLRRGSQGVVAAALTVLCVANVLVWNQHLSQFIRNGPRLLWTDAVLPLAHQLPRWGDRNIFMTDWGMEPTLRMLNEGKLRQLWNVSDVFSHEPGAEDRAQVTRMLSLPAVFITHTRAFEAQDGSTERALRIPAGLGYRRRLLSTINDSHGHPAFEIAEFGK